MQRNVLMRVILVALACSLLCITAFCQPAPVTLAVCSAGVCLENSPPSAVEYGLPIHEPNDCSPTERNESGESVCKRVDAEIVSPQPQQQQQPEQSEQVESRKYEYASVQHSVAEVEEEVRQVRDERMAQLQQRRQSDAVPVLPVDAPQQSKYDVEALTDILAMLETIAAADDMRAETADCAAGDQLSSEVEGESRVQDVAVARTAVTEVVVEEEVVVVVAGDRMGHSVLIEMHRLIFHADDSPCSHFSTEAQEHQLHQEEQQLSDMGLNAPVEWMKPMSSSTRSESVFYSMPLAQQVILVVVLLSAVLLLVATVTVACVMRHKHRQQRVLIEPPTIEQLGLDVPMLSSSPTTSAGQLLQL